MATCFVIQPFDARYNKRYTDVYKPAIEDAGLEPYRVDKDAAVSVPIEAIEAGIRNASVCLADITVDNPNVWYELGFAFAAKRPVIMTCSSEERVGKKYPFDIQHRTILQYLAQSTQDFTDLKRDITEKIKAVLRLDENLKATASATVAPTKGLTQTEMVTLGAIVNTVSVPSNDVPVYLVSQDVERAGLTKVGLNIAVRGLSRKGFIEAVELQDRGDTYDALRLLEPGWAWVEENQSLFALNNTSAKEALDDQIPF